MLDPIISAKEKLDDPLMLEWALRYYNDLPENSIAEKGRVASRPHGFMIFLLPNCSNEMKPKRYPICLTHILSWMCPSVRFLGQMARREEAHGRPMQR